MKRTATIAIAAFLLTLTPLNAQEKPAEEPKKPETKKEEAKELEFASREELIAHFEAEREKLRTQEEIIRRKVKVDYEKLREIQLEFRKTDSAHFKALKAYLGSKPQAKDLAAVRYDIVDFAYRLGEWQQCVDNAKIFLDKHGDTSRDLKRQATFLSASSLLNIVGKEKQAAAALAKVAENYKEHIEGGIARWSVVRAYVLNDEIIKAKRAVEKLLKMDDIRRDAEGLQRAKALSHGLLSIGKELPKATFTKVDRSGDSTDEIKKAKKPTLLWYWDTRDALSLRAAKDMEKLAKAYKGKVQFYAISVNKSAAAWRNHVNALEDSNMQHRFEGRLDSPALSSVQLGVNRYPLAILVGSDGKIYRFDTPTRDLKRTIDSWLKE